MSKRSTYRSEQEDFEKYFGDGLSEPARHDLEHHSLEDGFEAEAMEGWDEVSVEVARADLAEIRERLLPAKKSFYWMKIAAAVAVLVVASVVVLINFNQQPATLAQDSRVEPSPVPKEEAMKAAPPPEEAGNETISEPIADGTLEIVEEAIEIFEESTPIAEDKASAPELEIFENMRVAAPRLQARTEVTQDLTVADPAVSELAMVESEAEAPVQVLDAMEQDQAPVGYGPGQQRYSTVADDRLDIQSKDKWSSRQIHGNVFDEEGQIVSNARVALSGTPIRAVSDVGGKFEMAVPDSIDAPTLVFSSSGFDPLNYSIRDLDTFDVVMAREDQPGFINAYPSTRAARKRTENAAIEAYDEADFVRASPEGGYRKFEKYLKKHTRLPQEARQSGVKGTVLLTVELNEKGEITDISVKRGLGNGCDEEAIRIVQEGPSWLPAKLGEHEVASQVEIEVSFD